MYAPSEDVAPLELSALSLQLAGLSAHSCSRRLDAHDQDACSIAHSDGVATCSTASSTSSTSSWSHWSQGERVTLRMALDSSVSSRIAWKTISSQQFSSSRSCEQLRGMRNYMRKTCTENDTATHSPTIRKKRIHFCKKCKQPRLTGHECPFIV